MDDLTIARALHVVAVVHWIGGVSMVTLVILPGLILSVPPAERLRIFEAIEGRFGKQARISTLIAGLTGFYMTHRLGAWYRFADPNFWWMHTMVATWVIFTVVLFMAEPLYLHRWFHERAENDFGRQLPARREAACRAADAQSRHRGSCRSWRTRGALVKS